jgi:hypothetical protein
MWTWLGLGMVMLVAAMPLGCSTDEEDLHTQILRSAQSKGGTVNTPAPAVKLTGDWDAVIENYGNKASDGTYANVFRITQTGSEFKAIRLRDNPPPSVARAGSLSLQGEVDTNGFKRVDIVTGQGIISPSKGQIAADGKKIVIDNGATIRVTLTRP